MNHFKLEIIVDDFIELFDNEKMQIEFIELQLYNPDEDKKVVIKNRRFNVLYNSLNYPISFSLFILNNYNDNNQKIDYLMDEGYEIESVILDIYYDGTYIENYSFNPMVGEQVDLIKIIEEKKSFDITLNPFVAINSINSDLELLLMPINDSNYPIKRKIVSKDSEMNYGIRFNEDGLGFNIGPNNVLDSFDKVEVLISSKNTIISPKDLDYFAINIGKQLNINFLNNNEKTNKKHINLDSFGNLNLNYLSYYFRLSTIRTISLGYLTKEDNSIFFKYEISYLKESKSDILLKIKDFY